MRLNGPKCCLWLALLAMVSAPAAQAQRAEYMDPADSAAKAKQILQQLIGALGGQRYLQQKSSACEGRVAQFGHNGDTAGYVQAKLFWGYPDRFRRDLGKKGNIIDLFVGDQGWTLDHDGASEESGVAVAEFQESLGRNADNLLRSRLNDSGLLFRYGGNSVTELKVVDWIEITDSNERTFRLAVEQSTHLLVKSVVKTVDTETRERREDVTIYSNYQLKDGVQMPMQVSRERDGRRLNQNFFESCQVNPDLPADFFTKAALEKRFAEVGGKKKKN